MSGTPALSAASVLSRPDGLLEAEVDGEVLLLNIATGRYYGMNAVASRIWQLLGTPRRVDSIGAALVAEYAVEPDVCMGEIVTLLEYLKDEGLIALADDGADDHGS